jgi:hypothetical protein
MAAAQDTPNSRARAATESSSAPTRRHISARARSVSTARGAIHSDRSDHVFFSQSESGQRQIRLAHSNTTGRPATGKSRTATRRRPWATATAPHSGQPVESASLST